MQKVVFQYVRLKFETEKMNLKKCLSIQNKTIRDASYSLGDLTYTLPPIWKQLFPDSEHVIKALR